MMKLTHKKLEKIILEEIELTLKEGGAMQLIGQYTIQHITEDKEVAIALDVIRKYVSKHADYTYGIEEYKRVLEIVDEATGLMEAIKVKKEEEKRSHHGLAPRGAIKDKKDSPFPWAGEQ